MSRLFGFWDGQTTIRSDHDSPIRHAMGTAACDQFWHRDLEPGSLFWSGWREPNCFAGEACVAIVDGTFFDPPMKEARNDAERLVRLYRERGFAEALASINGDFAVALFDTTDHTIWLGRDRFGAKPMYYSADQDRLAFASRPRALLELPFVSAEPNQRYVNTFAGLHYRYFDNVPHESPYESIAQLPAATWLKFQRGQISSGAYWALQEKPDWEQDVGTLAEEYQQLMVDAVRIRLAAADRPGFTLSGGMDSSSVLSCAVHASGEKQLAFSTVYDDKTYDESDEIETILGDTVKSWQPISVGNPDVFGIVGKMVAVNDEPVATATWLSHYLLCGAAQSYGIDSFFGGLGGDELNAGEYEYFAFHFADLKREGKQKQLEAEIAKWSEYHDHPLYRKSFDSAMADVDRLVELEQPGRCRLDRRRYDRYIGALGEDRRQSISTTPTMDHPFRSYLKNRTFQDMTRETAPCCLRAEDRHASEHGLENYLPFFDHRLAEFMFRVPGELKIKDGVTKHLMRRAMKGILPDSTRNRIKKTGWNAPAHQWFSGKGAEPLNDLIRSARFRQRGIYDQPMIERLLAEHNQIVTTQANQENHMMFFWQLVNLELWLQSVEDRQNAKQSTDVYTAQRVA